MVGVMRAVRIARTPTTTRISTSVNPFWFGLGWGFLDFPDPKEYSCAEGRYGEGGDDWVIGGEKDECPSG